MSIYNINYNELARQLTPVRMRKSKHLAWLKVLLSPIILLYGAFLGFRNKILYELSFNGQVCRLEAALNDRFDNSLRRIVVKDAPIIGAVKFYRRAENQSVIMYRRSEDQPLNMRRRSEMTGRGRFVVEAPSAIVFDSNEMAALINKYKLIGRGYSIIIV
jgi:hypothetical protein